MYYPYFITYMSAGFVLSVVVLLWALKNGQFREQQRARFLPLEPEPRSAPAKTAFPRIEVYALMGLALAGLAASGAVLVFAIIQAKIW